MVQCTVLQMIERSECETVVITVHAKMIMPHFNGLYINQNGVFYIASRSSPSLSYHYGMRNRKERG